MSDKDKETIKLGAAIFGNIAAISVGVALFEEKGQAMIVAIFFGLMAFFSIRSLE